MTPRQRIKRLELDIQRKAQGQELVYTEIAHIEALLALVREWEKALSFYAGDINNIGARHALSILSQDDGQVTP